MGVHGWEYPLVGVVSAPGSGRGGRVARRWASWWWRARLPAAVPCARAGGLAGEVMASLARGGRVRRVASRLESRCHPQVASRHVVKAAILLSLTMRALPPPNLVLPWR
jgi:hypothetical protein